MHSLSCESPIWIFNNSIMLIQSFIFLLFVRKIDQLTQSQILAEKAEYGYPEKHFEDQRKSLRNMWMINKIYLTISVLGITHSIISYYWVNRLDDGNCFVITNIRGVDQFLKLYIYINNLILWQYPMIYLFWPSN